MKKNPLLHPEISQIIASLGEGDRLVIATADLPISTEMHRIDLALTKGIPSIEQTLIAVLTELHVREVVMAEELEGSNQEFVNSLKAILGDVPVTKVLYVALKQQTKLAKAVIRTGDLTKTGTIILSA
jgi:D-ribose pyranase